MTTTEMLQIKYNLTKERAEYAALIMECFRGKISPDYVAGVAKSISVDLIKTYAETWRSFLTQEPV